MKAVAALLFFFALPLIALPTQSAPRPVLDAVDLVLPGSGEAVRIQLALPGKSVSAAWETFLDRWFDYFDRDGNGWLSRTETAFVFPLPDKNGRGVALNFEKCDANRDGKIVRAELREFYRRAGFGPVQIALEPPSLQDVQVSEALFRHLGPDAAGKLTLDKLKCAEQLLRKLDEDEDEVLTVAEILSLGFDPHLKGPARTDFQCNPASNLPVAAPLELVLGDTPSPLLRLVKTDKLSQLPVLPDAAPRVRCGDTVLAFFQERETNARSVIHSRRFVTAQFKIAAGSKGWVEKRHLADDPSLQVLADIFPHADRDQDGKLTLPELESFLSLIELGATCTYVVRVTDAGRNLFCHLDTDGDGLLDKKELKAAAQVFRALDGSKGWRRNQVPHFARVAIYQGHGGDSFGPLPLVTASAQPLRKPGPSPKGPAWFRAMDANGDGHVSQAEFLGPIELFRKLDRNGDGLISPEEAEQAERATP